MADMDWENQYHRHYYIYLRVWLDKWMYMDIYKTRRCYRVHFDRATANPSHAGPG